MQIRRMTKADCEQVAAIEAVSFSVPWSLRAFTETVEKENFRYYVAEENGEILGYCGFLFVLDEAEIPNVCVKETARKRGVGTQMMQVYSSIQKEIRYLSDNQQNIPPKISSNKTAMPAAIDWLKKTRIKPVAKDMHVNAKKTITHKGKLNNFGQNVCLLFLAKFRYA